MKTTTSHIALIVFLLLLGGCGLFNSKQFHFLYENDATTVSISREAGNQPMKLFFTHDFPADYTYPTDTATNLPLPHTDLTVELYAENGELLSSIRDTADYYLFEEFEDEQYLSFTHPGININGHIQHSLVFPPFAEERSGWEKVTLKLTAYPYTYQETPIPGQRLLVTKVSGRDPVMELEIPFEVKF